MRSHANAYTDDDQTVEHIGANVGAAGFYTKEQFLAATTLTAGATGNTRRRLAHSPPM